MKIPRRLKKLVGNSYFTFSLISSGTGIRSLIITQRTITAFSALIFCILCSMTVNTWLNFRECENTRSSYKLVQAQLVTEQNKVKELMSYYRDISNSTEATIFNLSEQLPYNANGNENSVSEINRNNPFMTGDFSENSFHDNISSSFDLLFELSELISYLNNSYSTLQTRLDQLESIPDGLPMKGSLVSGFGMRKSPFGDHRHFHRGIDIINVVNSKVRAGGDGVVLSTGRNSLWGKNVLIDHGFGIKTQYGHLNKILVKKGQRLLKGDVIGRMGNTGRTTGPHLHYQVWVGENPQNPFMFISETELKKLHLMDTNSINNANLGGDGKR